MKLRQKLKSLFRRELLVFLITFLILFVGIDFSTHIHNTWLFHEFMLEGGFHLYDPYTSGGRQFVYSYGTVSYAISGFLYEFVGPFSLDFTEMVMFLIISIFTYYIVKNWKMRAMWLVLISIMALSDSFPNFVSGFFFIMAIYHFQKNKNRLFQSFILLASFNHPFMSMMALFFTSRKRKFLSASVILIFILQMTVLRTGFYNTSEDTYIGNQIVLASLRAFMLLFPFLLIPMEPTTVFYKIFNFLRSMRVKIYDLSVIGVCAIMVYLVFIMPSGKAFQDVRMFYTEDHFVDMPKLDGIVRIVDDGYFDAIMHLPKKGVVVSNSQYFEGRDYTFSGELCPYLRYLRENDISYVMVNREIIFSENEKTLLDENFEMIFKSEKHVIYDVTSTEELLREVECDTSSEPLFANADIPNFWITVSQYNTDKILKDVETWTKNNSENIFLGL